MRNSANEAKRMWLETFHVKDQVDYLAMDSKADDACLFREFKRQRRMNLITSCRLNMDKTLHRKKMIRFMSKPKSKKIYRERSYKGGDLIRRSFSPPFRWLGGWRSWSPPYGR
jgi:hypothetical protein